MTLIDLFDVLPIPEANSMTFSAISLPNYPNWRIAVDDEENAVLLLITDERIKNSSLKNFRLKYLQLEHNIVGKIFERNLHKSYTFTAITFKSSDRNLKEYFLRISETLIKAVGTNPDRQQLIDSIKKFVEIFRVLSNSPTNTVQGLWAELFIIDSAIKPQVLLDYWHNKPEEKFDFNAGSERIEVKSSSTFERKHVFSAEQLNPPPDTKVLIASIFTKQHSAGLSVQQLIDRIRIRINDDDSLVEKINNLVCQTLGNTIEQSIDVKFDYEIAKESLRFYRCQDICKIESIHIPNDVNEVRFKSDLTNVPQCELTNTQYNSILHSAL
jgi:hypothetical protein